MAASPARASVLLGLLLAVVNAALVIRARELVDPGRIFLASILLWVSAYPSWNYLLSRKHEAPFLPAFGAFYFFCYGLPAFGVLRVNLIRIQDEPAERAVTLALAGSVLLFFGFYSVRLSALPQLRLDLDLRRNAWLLFVVAVLSVAVRVSLGEKLLPAGVAQLGVFVNFLPTALLGGLLLLRLRGQLSNWIALPAALLLAVVLALDFGSASMAQPAMTSATLMFVYVAERRRVPASAIAIMGLLLIAGLGTKHEFRDQLMHSTHEIGSVERMNMIAGLMGNVFVGERQLDRATDVAKSRADHLSAFAWVISKTGETVPYWDGETYADFLWSFIPRFIYPDKPRKTLGQAYGHRYRFISANNVGTSINLEQTVEMYANFGVIGVLLGMFFMGVLYRALYRLLNHPQAGDGGLLIAAGTFRVVLNIESDFSLIFGGLLQSGALLYGMLYLLSRRRRAISTLVSDPRPPGGTA
jgi:hypothetical protein